jgi:hypothetical protein
MVRRVLAVLLAAVVLFVYQFSSWMFLGLHDGTLAAIPDEAAVAELLKSKNLQTMVYVYPWMQQADGQLDEAGMARHRQGPVFSIFYQAHGGEPMSPQVMGIGFGINVVAALIAVVLTSLTLPSCPRYWQRLLVVTSLGVFEAVFAHFAMWNWMWFPWAYVQAMMLDGVIGWMLAGLVIAALVRPKGVAATPAG